MSSSIDPGLVVPEKLAWESESADDGGQINFLNMDENDIEGAKSNLLRTLGAAAELLNSSGQ